MMKTHDVLENLKNCRKSAHHAFRAITHPACSLSLRLPTRAHWRTGPADSGISQHSLIGGSAITTQLNQKQLTAIHALKNLGYRMKQVMQTGEVQLVHSNRYARPCYIDQRGYLINHQQVRR